jgi:hypothetical protein
VVGDVEREGDALKIAITYIDVTASRVVFSFESRVATDDEAAFAAAVSELLHRILKGAAAAVDLRGEVESDKAEFERRKQEHAMLAASLADMEGDLAAMERVVPEGPIAPPKLTMEKLREEYGDRDDAKPWERYRMSEAEYVRYRNSGLTLVDWRHLARGRAARVTISAGFGPSWGPWGQQYDARAALDAETLITPVEVVEWQELDGGSGLVLGDVEASIGVHRWFEAGLYVTMRSTLYRYLFHAEVEGQPTDVDAPSLDRIVTSQVGARVHFVPMATSNVRPTAGMGIGRWSGARIDEISEMPAWAIPLDRPSLFLLEIAPGGEIDVGDTVTLYGRSSIEVPLFGDRLQQHQNGAPLLAEQSRSEPDHSYGAGLQLVVGVRARIGPLWGGDATPIETYE